MRVLYWSEHFWPLIGGVEVLAAHFLTTARQRGHDLVVVTSQSSARLPPEARYDDIPVHRFPFTQALLNRDLKAFASISRDIAGLMRAFDPDLVHMNLSGPSGFFHLRATLMEPRPTVVTVHAPVKGDFIAGGMLGQILRPADAIVAVSEALRRDIVELYPDTEPRTSVIYNGLIAPERPASPLPVDPPTLLCLGRVVPEKGFDLALQALALLRPTFPGVRLIVAGDGPERPALERLSETLDLQALVEFTGWIPPEGVPGLLDRTTVVVMPSRWREPFGLVALQAGQMARPIVASAVGGLPEIVIQGETGLLVDNESPAAVANAIASLLTEPERAARMGQAARRHVTARFGLERFFQSYEALFRQVGRTVPVQKG
jgi:glycogen(starch) synthase